MTIPVQGWIQQNPKRFHHNVVFAKICGDDVIYLLSSTSLIRRFLLFHLEFLFLWLLGFLWVSKRETRASGRKPEKPAINRSFKLASPVGFSYFIWTSFGYWVCPPPPLYFCYIVILITQETQRRCLRMRLG